MRAILWLGWKEIISLARDAAMVGLIVYAFSYAVIGPAKGARMELRDASIAVVDEDRSPLSARIADALLPPYFLPATTLSARDIDSALDASSTTFVLDIPPRFQADVEAGRAPTLQLHIDATAMSQAGRGSAYVQTIASQEVTSFTGHASSTPVALVTRSRFNPNLEEAWFMGISQIISNITMLAIILSGAAVVREREHGTLEHLLVMPLRPSEIMLAKVWSSALVIVAVSTLSLKLAVQWALDVPIAGSVPLFMLGTALYMFSMTSLGIFLATVARSMPQFGLLAFPTFIVLNLLSGAMTPLDSMPTWLQNAMLVSPTRHYVDFAAAILFRGGGLDVVWKSFAAVIAIGAVFFAGALMRFRKTLAAAQG
ncbi:ABC transporter permease [Derxia lacustris]|uniref:ABC transporter permease n=1 Tax=Derxia lacustris TaxID=764842 RepID=UPI000A174D52|nr:ABC transporter permease [Derxia lacustris]